LRERKRQQAARTPKLRSACHQPRAAFDMRQVHGLLRPALTADARFSFDKQFPRKI
jgi:hypothetical protein